MPAFASSAVTAGYRLQPSGRTAKRRKFCDPSHLRRRPVQRVSAHLTPKSHFCRRKMMNFSSLWPFLRFYYRVQCKLQRLMANAVDVVSSAAKLRPCSKICNGYYCLDGIALLLAKILRWSRPDLCLPASRTELTFDGDPLMSVGAIQLNVYTHTHQRGSAGDINDR